MYENDPSIIHSGEVSISETKKCKFTTEIGGEEQLFLKQFCNILYESQQSGIVSLMIKLRLPSLKLICPQQK